MKNKAWTISACLLAAVGSEIVRTEEPAIVPVKLHAQEGRFIVAHVHFHDRNPCDPYQFAEWMRANNVRLMINQSLDRT